MQMEKNKLRLFAILEAIIIVFAAATFIELYDHRIYSTNHNSTTMPINITYQSLNLSGTTQIYNFNNSTGNTPIFFTVPNGTMCLVFLMYTNKSIDCVCVVNSTGGLQASISNTAVLENFVGERIPYYSPITGANTHWHFIYIVNLEKGGNFNFKIYARNRILMRNQ